MQDLIELINSALPQYQCGTPHPTQNSKKN